MKSPTQQQMYQNRQQSSGRNQAPRQNQRSQSNSAGRNQVPAQNRNANYNPQYTQNLQLQAKPVLNYNHINVSVADTSRSTSYIYGGSPTSTTTNSTSITTQIIRKGFIRKVLAILMIQLSISTIAVGVTFIEKAKIRDFVNNFSYLTWVAIGFAVVTMLILMCKRDAARKVPMNYILSLVFTISISYLLMALASKTESLIVLFAGGFTVVITVAVSLYACFTKTDLTRKGYIIVGLVGVAILFIFLGPLFRYTILNVVYSAIIGTLFVFWLAYDIQRLTGRYEIQYSLDEYILAAMDIYIDIIQIFVLLTRTGGKR